MRKIKFRAWHEYGKHVVDPVEPGMIYDKNPGDCLHWLSQGQKILDIMQFTGLCDANGKEIYEGDIMIHPEFGKGRKLEVKFVNGCFCLGGWDCIRTDFSKGEVIGNIHETPDLMGEASGKE